MQVFSIFLNLQKSVLHVQMPNVKFGGGEKSEEVGKHCIWYGIEQEKNSFRRWEMNELGFKRKQKRQLKQL